MSHKLQNNFTKYKVHFKKLKDIIFIGFIKIVKYINLYFSNFIYLARQPFSKIYKKVIDKP